MDFNSWLADVDGKVIGDGQCVALAEDYITRVCGKPAVSTDGPDHPGYAVEMFANGPTAGFSQLPATAPCMPGYIPVWDWGYPFTPLSHVAVGVEDHVAMIRCMSQNPGSAHYMDIPKVGLLGYLVPGTGAQTAGDIHSKIGETGPLAQFPSLIKMMQWLSSADNWRRIGVGALGAILVLLVLVLVLDDSGGLKWTGATIRNIQSQIKA